MPGKGSIAPESDLNVVTIDTLNKALHPSTFQADDGSRSTSAGRVKDPMEINFLTELDQLLISHNYKKEMCNCPWRIVLDLKLLDENLAMEAVQKIGCMKCHKENIEVFNTSTNELAILIEFINEGCFAKSSRIQVYAPPGFSVGFVERSANCCSDSYEIFNNNGEIIYTVNPVYKMFHHPQFPIVTTEGDQIVAEVAAKGCGGYAYALDFKDRLTPSRRALIIGFALFLESVELTKRNSSVAVGSSIASSTCTILAIRTRTKSS